MPPIERFERNQKALLWARTGYGRYGYEVEAEPTEIDVRWEWTKKEVLDPQGNTIRIDAMAVVDRLVLVGSEMWLGELADWNGTGSGVDQNIMQVATYEEVPDVKGRETLREVGLIYKDSGDGG